VAIASCRLDLDAALPTLIDENTLLVACGYASNALGTINDVARICAAAREAGALSFVDAVAYARAATARRTPTANQKPPFPFPWRTPALPQCVALDNLNLKHRLKTTTVEQHIRVIWPDS